MLLNQALVNCFTPEWHEFTYCRKQVTKNLYLNLISTKLKMNSNNHFDVIILGAGSSGLYCAMHAAARGRRVLVVDHGPKPARKVRIAGGGKCNFTNLGLDHENYICSNPHFCKSALARHGQWDFIEFISSAGIEYEERDDGQLFTTSGAGRVAGLLVERCKRQGVEILLNSSIESVEKQDESYFSVVISGIEHTCSSLVIALGGPSYPQIGASRLGYEIAEKFGHDIVCPRPGLVPLRIGGHAGKVCRELSGNALPVKISCEGRSFSSDLLFTHKGISGPAVLQISNYWRKGSPVIVDLLPDKDVESMFEHDRSSKVSLKNYLGRCLPKKMIEELFPDIALEQVNRIGVSEERRIAFTLHNWELKPEGTESFSKAEVTIGGVDTDGISSKSMESKLVKGLYFTGEVMDVTGWLGGYNLQWAWSSGFAAAEFV